MSPNSGHQVWLVPVLFYTMLRGLPVSGVLGQSTNMVVVAFCVCVANSQHRAHPIGFCCSVAARLCAANLCVGVIPADTSPSVLAEFQVVKVTFHATWAAPTEKLEVCETSWVSQGSTAPACLPASTLPEN